MEGAVDREKACEVLSSGHDVALTTMIPLGFWGRGSCFQLCTHGGVCQAPVGMPKPMATQVALIKNSTSQNQTKRHKRGKWTCREERAKQASLR